MKKDQVRRGYRAGNVLLIFTSNIVWVLSCIIGWWASVLLRGMNVSDVGVPMYRHSELALAGGVFTYLGAAVLLWMVALRCIANRSAAVPIIGWCVLGLGSLPFLLLLMVTYI